MGHALVLTPHKHETPMGITDLVEFGSERDLAGRLNLDTDFGLLARRQGRGKRAGRREAVIETRLNEPLKPVIGEEPSLRITRHAEAMAPFRTSSGEGADKESSRSGRGSPASLSVPKNHGM